ncbi:BON domain-containing protein [Bdellovibrio sp. HCB2-146]|uniref:BON domain-containing protein n=1 Tax=Bdellovibrio sp. HCB2-146 TaxID=3394362 RepID=UPI0039BC67D8
MSSTLLHKIRERIKWDKRVSLADLDITIRGGVVIVNGFVDTSYKKNAALEIISEMEGVWAVEDRIVVPIDYYRTDDEIAQILKSTLAELVMIGGEHVEVEVVDGIVKLEGEVFRPRMKAMAVGAAWELSGVRDVLNFIEIREPPHRLPLEMEYESEFIRPSGDVSLEGSLKEVS